MIEGGYLKNMGAISGGPEKIWNKKQFLLHSPLQLKLWLVPKENKWWPKFTLLVFGLLLMEFSTATAEHTIDSRNVIEYKIMVSGNFIAACAMIVIVPWSGEKKIGLLYVSGKLPTYPLLDP